MAEQHESWVLQLTDDRSYIETSEGEVIAEVETWMDEEKEARAQLMTAAPDLLEALKFALECLTGEKNGWQRGWHDEEPYSNIAQAIKKATGK